MEITEKKTEETNIGGGNLKKLAAKAAKRIDADVDGDVDTDDPKSTEMGEFIPSPDGKKKIKTKVQREDFLSDWRDELFEGKKKNEDGEEVIDVMKGKNKITVSPTIGEKLELAKEENGEVRYCPACDKDETREECSKGPKYWDENSQPAKEEDPRGMKTKANLVRNKLRAMGLKMSHEPEGELVEYAGGGGAAPQMPAGVSKFVDDLPNKVKTAGSKIKDAVKSIPSGYSIKGNEIQMNSNELEGELIEARDESEEQEKQQRYAEKGQKETLANIKKITGKKQRLDKEKYTLQRKGKLPLNMSNEVEGETLEEGPAALAIKMGLAAGTAIAGTKIGQAAIDKVKGMVQRKKEAEAPYQKLLNQETEVEGETVSEEGADRLRDRRMERGGVGGNRRYDRPPARKKTNAELGIDPKAKTAAQKAAEAKYGKGASAMDIVKAQIRAKHGKGAIMDTKKNDK